ncbi:MAG TPA: penicillin-binding protein, partial [Paraburkholderia sp.]
MPIIKRPHSSHSPAGEDRDSDQRTSGRNGASREPTRGGRSIGGSIVLWFFGLIATAVVVGALIVGYALVVMGPQLPSLDALTDYRPKVPLR